MSEFNFKSQICTDLYQSKRLLALGLKKETADCALFLNGNNEFEQLSNFGNWEKYADMLPAWSLHRLWELANIKYIILYSRDEIAVLYDKVIMKIEQSIKKGIFKEEYLCEK